MDLLTLPTAANQPPPALMVGEPARLVIALLEPTLSVEVLRFAVGAGVTWITSADENLPSPAVKDATRQKYLPGTKSEIVYSRP